MTGAKDDIWQLMSLLVQDNSAELLHETLRLLNRMLRADEVALFAGAEAPNLIVAHGNLVIAESHGVDDPHIRRALDEGTTMRLDASQSEEPWVVDARTQIAAGLWVPLPPQDQVRGVLRVLCREPMDFGADIERLLEIVAQRLSIAVRHLRRDRSRQAHTAERTQLLLVATDIAEELEFGSVAQRVVDSVTNVTDFATATLEVREGNRVRRVAASGLANPRTGLVTALAGWETLLAEDRRIGELSYLVDAPSRTPPSQDAPAPFRLITSLRDRDNGLLGFLSVSNPRTGRKPSHESVETLELFAKQAQIALVNATLYVNARRQRDIAQSLMRLTAAVSSTLEREQVLETCCDAALAHSVGERAWVYLFDLDDEQVLHLLMMRGAQSPTPPAAYPTLPVGAVPAIGQALSSGEPVVAHDARSSAQFAESLLAKELGARSAAVYPLRSPDRNRGVLVVDSFRRRVRFPRQEVELLTQIAAQAAASLAQSRLHTQVREQATRNARLLELTTAMTRTFDFSQIFERIVNAVRGRMECHAVAVMLVEREHLRVLRTTSADSADFRRSARVPLHGPVARLVHQLAQRGTLRIGDARDVPAMSGLLLDSTQAVLLAGHREQGALDLILSVSSPRTHAFTAGDERFLAELVEITTLAFRNAQLYEEARRAADHDPLTGLHNRRVFWSMLERRLRGLDRDRTLALAVVDADDFKYINDRWGHAAGDRALQHLADCLRRAVRTTDSVYRIGGEEFTVVMPETTCRDAAAVLDHYSDSIRRPQSDLPPLSVSVGIAQAPQHGSTPDGLFRAADHALLHAKRTGKNRIVLSGSGRDRRPNDTPDGYPERR